MEHPLVRDRLLASKSYIVSEYQKGRGTSSLGEEFCCNPATVYLMLREWDVLDSERARSWAYGDASFEDKIVAGHAEGLSAYEISKRIGVSKPTVLRRGKKLGLSFADKSKLKKPVRLKDQTEEILALSDTGVSGNALAGKFGYSQSSVWRLLRDHGRDTSRQTYDVDLNFFDAIDSESKAYVLGFWYADGNVRADGIRVQVADLDIVEKIKDVMRYEGPIIELPPRKENRKVQYLLSISRKELRASIISKGCVPAKSLVTTFPGREIVPDHLRSHFVRGYFDGDGSLFRSSSRKTYAVAILGTREFLEGVADACGIPDGYWNQRFPERNKNNWTLTLTSKGRVERFCEYIYRDATIYLERKFQVYQQMLGEAASRRLAA